MDGNAADVAAAATDAAAALPKYFLVVRPQEP